MRMITEGLPLSRQERGVHQDIIAGADFLSILMDSPALRQAYRELTTSVPSTTVDSTLPMPSNSLNELIEETESTMHELRNPRATTEPYSFTQTPDDFSAKILQRGGNRTKLNVKATTIRSSSESNKINTSLVISVSVSSSAGNSHINKIPNDEIQKSKELDTDIITQTDTIALSSEDHPSLIAESSKSEFSVEENEPIMLGDSYTQKHPPTVQTISTFQSLPSPDKEQPFQHHSVVYHTDSKETARGRSVSYSTLIQTLPKQSDVKHWSGQNNNERQERHYDIKEGINSNQFEKFDEKYKGDEFSNKVIKEPAENLQKVSPSSVAESNDYFVTTKYVSSSEYQKDKSGDQIESLSTETISNKNMEPSEKNWELPEKHLNQREKPILSVVAQKQGNIPVIYGKPEQNYEVDESASVVSNGRIHGIQLNNKPQISTPIIHIKSDQSNDNQKVGYVVEGRNYRKYRVEERTSDGFIVGEYGVVSHNDGSLRGVRYTADGTTNPRLIYDALMKFLSL